MTRERAKELLPIIQAFARGKAIEVYLIKEDKWVECDDPCFWLTPECYRIKPKPKYKYRPFRTKEEYWSEMLNHQPFGWIRSNKSDSLSLVEYVSDVIYFNGTFISYKNAFECSEFIDGTPFGIKED